MRAIVEAVVDRGTLLRDGALYGRAVITGLRRLDGWPVALMASDPYHYGGAWTADACQKIDPLRRHGADLPPADRAPGGLPGLPGRAGRGEDGDDPQGVRALSAIYQTTVPWCAVIVRNVFGVAGAAPPQRSASYCVRYAWPSASWGSLPLEGGIEAAYRAEIDARRGSAGQDGRDRGAADQAALAVPDRPSRSGSRRSSIRARRAR